MYPPVFKYHQITFCFMKNKNPFFVSSFVPSNLEIRIFGMINHWTGTGNLLNSSKGASTIFNAISLIAYSFHSLIHSLVLILERLMGMYG